MSTGWEAQWFDLRAEPMSGAELLAAVLSTGDVVGGDEPGEIDDDERPGR